MKVGDYLRFPDDLFSSLGRLTLGLTGVCSGRGAWGLWWWQVVLSQGACLRVAQHGLTWAAARPPVLPALPGGWGPLEAEEGCLTQAHTVTQGLGPRAPGTWPGEPPWEVMGGGAGLFCSGLCVFVSVCVFGLLSRQHSLSCCLACTRSPLVATRPGGSPASLGPSPWMLPTVDAASAPSALGFQTFPHSALTSLTHRAPQAFRCYKQDLNPMVWQVSACPSSLTPVGGWLAQRRLHSAACGAGEQDSGCLVWSPGTLLCSSHPVLQEVSLQIPQASVVRQTQPGMAC